MNKFKVQILSEDGIRYEKIVFAPHYIVAAEHVQRESPTCTVLGVIFIE